MPTELRRLIFSRDELAAAIAHYNKESPNGMPSGHVMYCKISQNEDLQITVKILPDGESDVQTVELTTDTVASALMQYCLANKIPMPRKSHKTLQAIAGNIEMNLLIDGTSKDVPGHI